MKMPCTGRATTWPLELRQQTAQVTKRGSSACRCFPGQGMGVVLPVFRAALGRSVYRQLHSACRIILCHSLGILGRGPARLVMVTGLVTMDHSRVCLSF